MNLIIFLLPVFDRQLRPNPTETITFRECEIALKYRDAPRLIGRAHDAKSGRRGNPLWM
jgi:hypothetical protein